MASSSNYQLKTAEANASAVSFLWVSSCRSTSRASIGQSGSPATTSIAKLESMCECKCLMKQHRNSHRLPLFERHFCDQSFGTGSHFTQLRGDHGLFRHARFFDLRPKHLQLCATLSPASDFSLTFASAHVDLQNLKDGPAALIFIPFFTTAPRYRPEVHNHQGFRKSANLP